MQVTLFRQRSLFLVFHLKRPCVRDQSMMMPSPDLRYGYDRHNNRTQPQNSQKKTRIKLKSHVPDRKITFICTFRIIVSNQGLLNIQVWFLNKKVSSLIKLGLPFLSGIPHTRPKHVTLSDLITVLRNFICSSFLTRTVSKQDGNLLLKPIANSNRQARDCKQFIICYAVKSRIKTNKSF